MQIIQWIVAVVIISLAIMGCGQSGESSKVVPASEQEIQEARRNAEQAREGYIRCTRFVEGWLDRADPETGLIPRNLEADSDIWNAKDAAADNYPFMVLTAALTDQALFEGRMREMLATETKLTSRVRAMPDTYSFSKKGFANEEINLEEIIFGTSEYIKDGLIPLTEWLGESPWSVRMISMLDDLWAHAPIETAFGNIVSENVEVNGEMLQTLSRIYWMQQDPKYLEWALRLGDYYLLDEHHPSSDFEALRLRDHGCEIVSGLCELYVTLSFVDKEKEMTYQPHIHQLLDDILEHGRNEHGLFYNIVNPQTGEIINPGIADNFGYTLNGFYSVYLIDSVTEYREAAELALNSLNPHYRNFDWERGSADGYADAIEGALNLYNRLQIKSVADWMDSEMQVMWSKQQENGIIEGWHGDGNFARTTIMYNLWKSQGAYAHPWHENLRLGAIEKEDGIILLLESEEDWSGKIHLDYQRHKHILHLPIDWPRINQFPEWFTVKDGQFYDVINLDSGDQEKVTGEALKNGYPIDLEIGEVLTLLIKPQ
ncbi:MAG: hypothetical protein HKN87_15245 [Saprospiraceae bacterium]|nr:hypothetical protein [Saprospiraceae bacterium]